MTDSCGRGQAGETPQSPWARGGSPPPSRKAVIQPARFLYCKVSSIFTACSYDNNDFICKSRTITVYFSQTTLKLDKLKLS